VTDAAESAQPGWRVLTSGLDASVNFLRDTEDGGLLECRYVRRSPDYVIAYLSSHSGCRHACRFCHLTQSGQTMFRESSPWDLMAQAMQVLGHYDRLQAPAERLHVNFMARGDALSSRVVTGRFAEFAAPLRAEARRRGLDIRFNVSTIFPRDADDVDLATAFSGFPVTLFWSLYGLDPGFRRRWMPRAAAPEASLARLVDWQGRTGGDVVLHWALISGKNDHPEDIRRISEMISASGLKARFNLVRYNSWSERTGVEADAATIEEAMAILEPAMRLPGSRIVPRVGFDVKASCGMFVDAS
jgi:23S rRNA (adenine2503-C2)-methyltransferase